MRGKPTITFIYGLHDPRDGACFYVGKADNPQVRIKQHLKCRLNPGKADRIRAICEAGQAVEIRILQQVAVEDWESCEIYWISHLREKGEPLTNISAGGVTRGISPEMADWLLTEMPKNVNRMNSQIDQAIERVRATTISKPWGASLLRCTEAGLEGIRTLTPILLKSKDRAVKLKAAYSMHKLIVSLEARGFRERSVRMDT